VWRFHRQCCERVRAAGGHLYASQAKRAVTVALANRSSANTGDVHYTFLSPLRRIDA
jgi:hypothetical protein